MMFSRIAIAALFLLSSSICLAQANLALTEDGKLVGWLLGKRSNSAGEMTFQYLTPDGYILSLKYLTLPDSLGSIPVCSNTLGTVVNELFYESSDCTGQAWVHHTHELIGEIAQLGVNAESPVFFRTGFDAFSAPRTFESKKDATGSCTQGIQVKEQGIFVSEIDPADYGFIFFENLPHEEGHWLIPSKTHEVQRPNTIFCNGFEGCPTE